MHRCLNIIIQDSIFNAVKRLLNKIINIIIQNCTITFISSPPSLIVFSRKSTPIVASHFSGNFPPQKRNVRHVLPTFESPMTIILKTRFWPGWSCTTLADSSSWVSEDCVSMPASIRLPFGMTSEGVELDLLTHERLSASILFSFYKSNLQQMQ